LDAAGVKIVTVSTDTSSQIRMGRAVHGLQATMLADPKLLVTELFGFRNKNINNFKTPGRPGLPVPTSLLIDEQGIVVWKDQSANYTQRSDPDIVGEALREQFAV
jgi:peroxiredoxin